MTEETFIALVKRLEGEAAQRPGRYRLRVLLLALLGYGYVLGILAGTVALIVLVLLYGRFGGLILKLEIVLLVFAGMILRALWVRLSPPQGLPIERRDAQVLFDEIDRLRQSLRTPPIHQVLLTAEVNASMAQVPRLGILGWQKNYLTLGLPLMQSLSPAGFRSVLAHELGHLSRTHGRFTGWIYRVRKAWEQLLEELEKRRHRGAVLFKRFFAWYAPYFSACSFVLARAQEYEADRLAAQAAGPREAAQALVTVAMAGDYLARDFWPSFFQRAVSQPRPDDAVHEVGRVVGGGAWRETAAERMERVVDAETEVQDSHPCLRDRLAALGEKPALPEPVDESAAEHYLGAALPALAERLAAGWTAEIAPAWQQRYEEAQQQRERLSALEEKSRAEPLGAEESFEQALLTESLAGEAAALPLYRAVLAIEPGHAGASFQLGRILLEREDPEGVHWMEAAMQGDAGFNLAGSQILAAYWKSQGEADRARAHREKAEQ
ncbi:MAG TPA: M48 family metalloprotease, partial [Thermoanaerobaculia bacterium]